MSVKYRGIMAGNSNLSRAKRAKKDEFYTQLDDIENELRHYCNHFRGKTILCNCDAPYESNFFKYFALQFNALGLRKLIATSYADSPVACRQLMLPFKDGAEDASFAQAPEALRRSRAYKAVVTEVRNATGGGGIDMLDVAGLFRQGENALTELAGDGDFRSAECLRLLDEADVVVTNPPFSLFREYVATLLAHGKKFIIIGNINAITYKEVFPLMRENKIWLGVTSFNTGMYFRVPDYFVHAPSYKFDRERNGVKVNRVAGTCWYTNLDIPKRHEELVLVRSYSKNPECYPRYDNYDAIEVSKVADIPYDYGGVMGVPITFMDKYNPEQFEILGASESEGRGFACGIWNAASGVAQPQVNGVRVYKRLFIARRASS